MSILKDFLKANPVQADLYEKARCVRIWWRDRCGSYCDTERQKDDITFTELNERRAASRVAHFGFLMSRAQSGCLNDDDIREIERAYKRLPRLWRTAP